MSILELALHKSPWHSHEIISTPGGETRGQLSRKNSKIYWFRNYWNYCFWNSGILTLRWSWLSTFLLAYVFRKITARSNDSHFLVYWVLNIKSRLNPGIYSLNFCQTFLKNFPTKRCRHVRWIVHFITICLSQWKLLEGIFTLWIVVTVAVKTPNRKHRNDCRWNN